MNDEEIHQCALFGKIPHFHLPELLPLLLLGITDDCIDIATSTYDKLEAIGEIYKKFIDVLDTRVSRYRTVEEDAKIMEKVIEEDRKCQERYERELQEKQEGEQQLWKTENDIGKTTSSGITLQDKSTKKAPIAQTIKNDI